MIGMLRCTSESVWDDGRGDVRVMRCDRARWHVWLSYGFLQRAHHHDADGWGGSWGLQAKGKRNRKVAR